MWQISSRFYSILYVFNIWRSICPSFICLYIQYGYEWSNALPQSSDSEDEEEGGRGINEARLERRREKRLWEQKRNKVLFDYAQFSYFAGSVGFLNTIECLVNFCFLMWFEWDFRLLLFSYSNVFESLLPEYDSSLLLLLIDWVIYSLIFSRFQSASLMFDLAWKLSKDSNELLW